MCGCAYILAFTCVLFWFLYRAVLSDGPQQDLVLDTSGDYVVVHYSECSTSSEEEVEESENGKVGSCTVLCAPLSDEDKEDWDAV